MHCIFLCLRNVHQILCMEPICMFIDDSFSFLILYTKCQKLLTLSFLYYMMKMSRVFDIQNILPKGENIMPVPAQIFLGVVFLVFVVLDIIMLISLLKPGDERNQIIVWKAGSFTLFATVGAKIIEVIENIARAQPMTANPLVQVEVAAVIYCISLMYYKKRYGG